MNTKNWVKILEEVKDNWEYWDENSRHDFLEEFLLFLPKETAHTVTESIYYVYPIGDNTFVTKLSH